MKKKFVYLFTIGGKIHWSGDTAETLINARASTPDDKAEVKEFVETADVGSHIQISTGEFIFRTA
jgi:hypothetical protein